VLFFQPRTKFQLYKYWQVLEQLEFDPVEEYNKALEHYITHYHPNEEELFKIMMQISRFLKEFSDFEGTETCDFRHPNIQGTVIDLDSIGLLREIIMMKMYEDEDSTKEIFDKIEKDNLVVLESEKFKRIRLKRDVQTLNLFETMTNEKNKQAVWASNLKFAMLASRHQFNSYYLAALEAPQGGLAKGDKKPVAEESAQGYFDCVEQSEEWP